MQLEGIMTTRVRIIFAILLLVPACNRNNPNRARAESEQESTSTANMQRQRDDYVKAVEAKLDEFDHKIDGLETRASTMTGTLKKNFTSEIDQLRDQRTMIARKLDDLKKVSIDSWTGMKGAVDSAFSDLERSYETVSSKYAATSAPTSQNPIKTY
jgi:hypothetical protein